MVKSQRLHLVEKFKMIQDAGFDGVELNRPDALPLDELLQAKSDDRAASRECDLLHALGQAAHRAGSRRARAGAYAA